MIRKTVAIVSAALFLLIFAGNVFAGFDALYTTDDDKSTVAKTTFDWDELPWLYLNVSGAAGKLLTASSTWTSPGGTPYVAGDELMGSKMWLAFVSDWSSIRATGVWNIDANYSYSGGSGTGSTTFTVTPEPLSSALFLFGGLVLAAGYRKKKTKA